MGDLLANKNPPVPLEKTYFAYKDEARSRWNAPTLILVHASEDFHYPFIMKKDLERRVNQFRKTGNPIVFLMHNDQFRDASYIVRPHAKDLMFFTETGQHPLCEDCSEVTLAGGYIDYCLGLAARSYIANYFRNRDSGEIRLNFAADSIYTETDSGPNSMGGNTALSEIKKDGIQKFIERRIGPYLENRAIKSATKMICPLDKPADLRCQKRARQAVLSGVHGQDKDGRHFPRLEESKFYIRVQVDGQDYAYPFGDKESPRRITFNIETSSK